MLNFVMVLSRGVFILVYSLEIYSLEILEFWVSLITLRFQYYGWLLEKLWLATQKNYILFQQSQ